MSPDDLVNAPNLDHDEYIASASVATDDRSHANDDIIPPIKTKNRVTRLATISRIATPTDEAQFSFQLAVTTRSHARQASPPPPLPQQQQQPSGTAAQTAGVNNSLHCPDDKTDPTSVLESTGFHSSSGTPAPPNDSGGDRQQNEHTLLHITSRYSCDEWRHKQQTCEQVKHMYAFKRDGILPEDDKLAKAIVLDADNYILAQDSLLYHLKRVSKRHRSRLHQFHRQLVVPECWRDDIMRGFHEEQSHAKFGKQYLAMLEFVYWQHMSRDVAIHIA